MESNKRSGFTVMELLVGIAVAAILFLMISAVFRQSTSSLIREGERIDSQAIIRKVGLTVEKDLRSTIFENVPTLSPEGIYIIGDYEYKLDNNELTRDGVSIAENIDAFDIRGEDIVELNENNDAPDKEDIIVVSIKTLPDRNNIKESITIKVSLRR